MGCVENITFDNFPKQTDWLSKKVEVCFHYDTSQFVGGEIVRDDAEKPGKMIIKLDDGRFVLSTEVQYSIK